MGKQKLENRKPKSHKSKLKTKKLIQANHQIIKRFLAKLEDQ